MKREIGRVMLYGQETETGILITMEARIHKSIPKEDFMSLLNETYTKGHINKPTEPIKDPTMN